ncbi:hypothetical protein CRV24_008741 [Beauveria bassiana]|nr:hypothetical protein CRV24_008741 [Beauveria bassiana]
MLNCRLAVRLSRFVAWSRSARQLDDFSFVCSFFLDEVRGFSEPTRLFLWADSVSFFGARLVASKRTYSYLFFVLFFFFFSTQQWNNIFSADCNLLSLAVMTLPLSLPVLTSFCM